LKHYNDFITTILKQLIITKIYEAISPQEMVAGNLARLIRRVSGRVLSGAVKVQDFLPFVHTAWASLFDLASSDISFASSFVVGVNRQQLRFG
jgi:hypothetical protein